MIEIGGRITGGNNIKRYLDNFFHHNPWNLPIPLHVLGHNRTASGTDIIISIHEGAKIATYISIQTPYSTRLGGNGSVDGDGLKNWISFKREVRINDPRSVARCALLALLELHHLITW